MYLPECLFPYFYKSWKDSVVLDKIAYKIPALMHSAFSTKFVRTFFHLLLWPLVHWRRKHLAQTSSYYVLKASNSKAKNEL